MFSARECDDFYAGEASNPNRYGIGIVGPVERKSSSGMQKKCYFSAYHPPEAYFGYEIMCLLGIQTPKSRLAKNESLVYSKEIEGFISLWMLKKHGLTYDADNQLIKDANGQVYKIAGMYGVDIIGSLLQDWDMLNGANFGFVRIGNRFYFVAIDKEKVEFTGKNYDAILYPRNSNNIYYDTYFDSQTPDQIIAVLSKLADSLKEDKNAECDIDRIFKNRRVQTTFTGTRLNQFEEIIDWCKNFKKSARSCLEFFERKEKFGADFLTKFHARETIRETIANRIIEKLGNVANPKELAELIIADLRAPYYQSLFKNNAEISQDDLDNPDLLSAVFNDIDQEFNLQSRYTKFSPRFFEVLPEWEAHSVRQNPHKNIFRIG